MNPIAALLIFPISWIATVAGRQINRRLCPVINSEEIAPLVRNVFGLASGFVLLALGIMILGVSGLLSVLPVAAWCVVLGIVGGSEHARFYDDVKAGLEGWRQAKWMFVGGLVVVALAALGGCFVPPTSVEWDSLSYHLADPKLYILAHRIYYLPWESHSNFAFDMEMLYCIGMMLHSIALAKMFHFVIGVTGAVGVYLLAQMIDRKIAILSVIVYATLPLVFWEAGTAYVDLAATTFGILALLALALVVKTGDRQFVLIAGVMLGGMFGIKATALITIGLYALGLPIYARLRQQPIAPAIKSASVMTVIALALGSPWYIKSWIYTKNPFYPFAYSLFGGRYWSKANGVDYSAAQYKFGVGHGVSDLILAPWNLTMYLVPGHYPPAGFLQPFNDYQTLQSSLSPLFVICAIAALAIPMRSTKAVGLLRTYSVATLVVWFFLTQQVRYLLPLTPVLSILSAWVMVRLAEGSSRVIKAASTIAVVLAVGFNIVADFAYAASEWSVAASPSRAYEYIARGLNTYTAMQVINTQTPADAKVACYGEPRTLYLNRDHMWAEPGHSLYIPYSTLKTPDGLRDWFHVHGYTYILINLETPMFAPQQPQAGWAGMLYGLTLGSGSAPVFQNRSTVVYAI